MKHKLRSVLLLIAVLLLLLPLNRAAAVVVNSPVVVDRGQEESEEIAAFSVLTIGMPNFDDSSYPHLDASLNNLPMIESRTNQGIQGLIPHWMYLNVSGVIDGFSPSPIPTSVLLIGTSFIGLIGIARRSFFTR